MSEIILESAYFKQLKGLNEVTLNFSETLTAIMGVNGAGKTTVIHALACVFQPNLSKEYSKGEKEKHVSGENHRFSEFFVPNTDARWSGSEFTVCYRQVTNKTNKEKKEDRSETSIKKEFKKALDRWSPRYSSRAQRPVYYIGIDTCLPEIERRTNTGSITYKSAPYSQRVEEKKAQDICKMAAYILGKAYEQLWDNVYMTNQNTRKHLLGVSIKSDDGVELKYSSLSMGTGEQRVLKILEKVICAEHNSLILIDEVDLLLHVASLRRLIEKLEELAKKRKLQIIFTTHSTEMISLQDKVCIQYIDNKMTGNNTSVYSRIGVDLLYSLTGENRRPVKVYVEDEFAKNIIQEIAMRNNMIRYIEIIAYGSVENAFTLAASTVIRENESDNQEGKRVTTIIVTDGDCYRSEEERLKQIEKKMSGTEHWQSERRSRALSIITQFCPPNKESPEQFFYELVLKNCDRDGELYKCANEINTHGNTDKHCAIYEIKKRTNYCDKDIVSKVFECSGGNPEMQKYIEDVKAKLSEATIAYKEATIAYK